MPTATEFFGITARNLGPLTTTYTAPSSCATNLDHPLFVDASSPHVVVAMPMCTWPSYGDCIPSIKEWESTIEHTTTFYQGTSLFYSPGLACPAGWETVGVLAHTESGKFRASGALTLTQSNMHDLPEYIHPSVYWKNILDESETIAYCCPSGFEANVHGNCVSTLGPVSSYTYSEYCQVYGNGGAGLTIVSSVDGVTNTEGVFSIVKPSRTFEATTTSTGDLGELQEELQETVYGSTDIVVASWVPGIPLVYKKSDMDKKGENDDSETGTAKATQGSDESETGTAAATGGSDESAASTVPRQSAVGVLGLTLGLLAGTSMLLF